MRITGRGREVPDRARSWAADLTANGVGGKFFGLFGVIASTASLVQFVLPDVPKQVSSEL